MDALDGFDATAGTFIREPISGIFHTRRRSASFNSRRI